MILNDICAYVGVRPLIGYTRFRFSKQSLIPLLLVVVMACACAKTEYRVDRIDGSQSIRLPFQFDSMQGMRDGESVTADPLFKNGNDSMRMNIHVRLGPPIQFTYGDYRADIEGRTSEGPVICDSLSFLGGQNALPSVGGIFVLKDSSGHTLYRVTMPPTPITRRNSISF